MLDEHWPWSLPGSVGQQAFEFICSSNAGALGRFHNRHGRPASAPKAVSHTTHKHARTRARVCVCVCFLWRASGWMSAMKPSPSFSKASPFTRTCCRDSPGGDAAEWHVEERGRKVCATCGKGKPTRSLKTCILLLTRTGNGTLS